MSGEDALRVDDSMSLPPTVTPPMPARSKMSNNTRNSPRSILFVWMLAIMLFAGAVSAVFTAILVYYRTTDLMSAADARLLMAAEMAREIVGPSYHDTIEGSASVSAEQFDRIVERNDDLCRRLGLQYLWSVLQVADNELVFTSATHSDITDPASPCASFFEVHRDPGAFEPALEPGMQPSFSSFHNEWGAGRQVLIPRQDAQGRTYIFGASIQLTEYNAIVFRSVLTGLGIWLAVMGIAFPVGLVLSRRLTAPINVLTRAADRMASGDLDAGLPPTGTKEIQSLARSLDRMRQDQRLKMAALRENQDTLRQVLDTVPQSIFWKDRDGTYLGCNQVFARACGLADPDEIAGKTDYDLHWPVAEAEAYRVDDAQVVSSGTARRHIVEPLQQADGTRLWIDTSKLPLRDARDEVRGVLGVYDDVTERKRAEEAWAERQEYLQAILRTTADGFIVLDAELRLIDVNDAYCRMSGYTRDELLALCLGDLNAVESAADRAARKERIVETGSEVFETRHRRKDGSVFDVEVSVSYLDRDSGSFVCFSRDITRRKQAEQEREALNAQLSQAQKLESVGQLAGGVAHDFNNMLTAILGYADLALDETDPASSVRHRLIEIQQAAQRSADLTRQLLAFARRQTVTPRVLDLNEAVEGMFKLLRRLIGEDIELVWKPGQALWNVRIDPSQVDQLLANLTVNARDAIAGVGRVTVQTTNVALDAEECADHAGYVSGEYVMLAVSDNGCGMDRETLTHVFEPFFTTKGVGQGTGLGLATVYGIVKQNEGFIDLASEPGQGTTFAVYLPRYVGETAGGPAVAKPAIPHGGETVLLVEDEPAILELGKAVLQRLGYTVLATSTPVEALHLAATHSGAIHLLITDVVMPEMNGRVLAAEVTTLKPGLRCLFMSGYTADVIGRQGIVDEGVHFIQKPFTVQVLAEKVRAALESD